MSCIRRAGTDGSGFAVDDTVDPNAPRTSRFTVLPVPLDAMPRDRDDGMKASLDRDRRWDRAAGRAASGRFAVGYSAEGVKSAGIVGANNAAVISVAMAVNACCKSSRHDTLATGAGSVAATYTL